MEDQYFGMKELYQVSIKATSSMKIGNRTLQAGQPITYFDNIQIASISEDVRPIYAKGGRNNDTLIVWQQRENVSFRMSCGVLSNVGLALLSNAIVINPTDARTPVNVTNVIECDSYGKCSLNHNALCSTKPVFCFIYTNGIIQNKVTPLSVDYDNGIINLGTQYSGQMVLIDYYYYYEKQRQVFVLQKQRFNGLLQLSGKFYRKGEQDGVNRTSEFRMPKVRIVSNLNIELGSISSPAVSNFNIIAMPTKTEFSNSGIMQIHNFEEDIS